jgi:phosphoribosylformylglycinamidine synthase
VQLDRVPLKYEGLSYWEIWISEAQERMVLAVPPSHAAQLEALRGSRTSRPPTSASSLDRGASCSNTTDTAWATLDLHFLHEGRPRWHASRSTFRPEPPRPQWTPAAPLGKALHAILRCAERSVEGVDHPAVRPRGAGPSVLKPLQGVDEDGPGDGVAFAPRFGSARGIVLGCGLNPCYGDLDPYRMALSAVDEAVRNVVAAGGDPDRTAILDNFCWGNTDRPEILGSPRGSGPRLPRRGRCAEDAFHLGQGQPPERVRVGEKTDLDSPDAARLVALGGLRHRRLVSMDLKKRAADSCWWAQTLEELGGSHYFAHLVCRAEWCRACSSSRRRGSIARCTT